MKTRFVLPLALNLVAIVFVPMWERTGLLTAKLHWQFVPSGAELMPDSISLPILLAELSFIWMLFFALSKKETTKA